MIKLLDIDSVKPSTYNPRHSDPLRLDLIELSLRKLGWLLPIYADQDGEILSGHQRQLVARRLGCRQVPVEFLPAADLTRRKGINILFNRGTNDFSRDETTADSMQKMKAFDPFEKAKGLPDIPLDSTAFYPCMATAFGLLPTKSLLKANAGRWNRYAKETGKSLLAIGVVMPIVITEDLAVVNGIGRLEAMAEKGHSQIPTITITPEQAEFARAMLNYLTMDFDVATRYRDYLRHNSFRRPLQVRKHFGLGFVQFAGFKNGPAFDIKNPKHRAQWKKVHGQSILDFGAGHRTETNLLKEAGFDVTPFEPYPLGPGRTVDADLGRQMTRDFLEVVAAGKSFDSIFISSVLNSVPFVEDRRCIVRIVQALSTKQTRVFVATINRKETAWQNLRRDYIHGGRNTAQFQLDYEPGTVVADLTHSPKVQKFHTVEEIRDLFGLGFHHVKAVSREKNILAICKDPKPYDFPSLRHAIAFEFDLPYEDGSRMGLVSEAFAAFRKRFGDNAL